MKDKTTSVKYQMIYLKTYPTLIILNLLKSINMINVDVIKLYLFVFEKVVSSFGDVVSFFRNVVSFFRVVYG